MPSSVNRRQFLGASAGALALPTLTYAASDKIVVGVMGTGGRGTSLAVSLQNQPNVEVAYVCDADAGRAKSAAEAVRQAREGQAPQVVGDFRRILDDKSVDVLVVAACNHWHAPAAILGCAAGKHVYVEKPCSHNPQEGEWLVQAARKHKRHVQMGNQRRSWPKVIEGIEQVRAGAIGRVYLAQSWYHNQRPTIGRGKIGPPPAGLDYALWQGPAPHRPYQSNFLHYHWHWFWHWGNGELGNNGVHMIDVCRWGLGVEYPLQVTSSGGRFRYDDDQETPDTHQVSFLFAGNKQITWEGLSCSKMPAPGTPDALFHGEKGTLAIRGGGYTIHDAKGKEIKKVTGPAGDESHLVNFLSAVRQNSQLHSEIAEGHISTLLCHLGNIAHRTGRVLHCDPRNGHLVKDAEAQTYWKRDYAPGWEPKV